MPNARTASRAHCWSAASPLPCATSSYSASASRHCCCSSRATALPASARYRSPPSTPGSAATALNASSARAWSFSLSAASPTTSEASAANSGVLPATWARLIASAYSSRL